MLQAISAFQGESRSLNEVLDYALTTIIAELGCKFGAIVLFRNGSGYLTHYINSSFPRELIQYVETISPDEAIQFQSEQRERVVIYNNEPNRTLNDMVISDEKAIFNFISGITLLLKSNSETSGLMHFFNDEPFNMPESVIGELNDISSLISSKILHSQSPRKQTQIRKKPNEKLGSFG